LFEQISQAADLEKELAARKALSRAFKYFEDYELINSGLHKELKGSPEALRYLTSGSLFGYSFILIGPFESIKNWVFSLDLPINQGLIPLGKSRGAMVIGWEGA
jgi:hypothetical protein